MKKLFLIGIAATAMLVSCSNDETMETAQPTTEAIGFNAFVNKSTRGGVSTRGIANDITNDGTNGTTAFKDYKVWGSMKKVGENAATVFTGTKVSKQTDGSWKYDIGNTPIQYWEPGYNYKFTAIAPDATNITFVAPDADASWENYGSIQFNNGVDTDQSKTAGTTDLIWDIDGEWATKVIPTDVCPAPIAFTFKHLLSRVKFQFVSEYLDGSQMNVTDVKITKANVKSTAK